MVDSEGGRYLVTMNGDQRHIERKQTMPSPYNLTIQDSCTNCTLPRARKFCDLSPKALEDLQQVKFTGMYPKGSTLFVEGEKPRGVFILCSGKAKLTTSSSEGKTLIVRMAEAGEILGLGSTILDRAHEQSAETVEPCQVNFIRREEFLRLVNTHPEVCLRVAQQLSKTVLSAERDIRTFGLSQTTSERLAKLILDWCKTGEDTGKGIRVKVLLTHEEMAQMIGTTRETVTRVMSDFKRKKLIDVKGSTVFVPRGQGLTDMVTV
jgi:CRP/FNR family transcriptional regulator, cyclic AMP receptor protein